MTSTKKSSGNLKVNSSKSGNTNFNKTKYFRLRLSDEVGTERPETDLRQTYERKMKIQCFRELCPGQTHRVTPWAP